MTQIGKYTLTAEEKIQLYISLSARCGFIETGTIRRAEDLVKSDPNFRLKILSREQQELIYKFEDWMKELL